MFNPDGTRLAHPGWVHFDIDHDNFIACQHCSDRYVRTVVMSILLGHTMEAHGEVNCYTFKKSAGFFDQKRCLLTLGKDNPGWKYFEALNDQTVACKLCKKVHTNADVSRLLTHLQQAHRTKSFNDFRADVLASLNSSGIVRNREGNREAGEALSSSATSTPPASPFIDNTIVDDKSRIVRISQGLATSSSVNLGSAAAVLTLAPRPPIKPELSEDASDGEVEQPRRKIAKKNKLTRSREDLRIVTNRMARKWQQVDRMRPSAFKKPKTMVTTTGYWTNGCYKRYFKCREQRSGCPCRMVTVNNKRTLKSFQYRNHDHTVSESSSSSSSSSSSE